MRNIPIPVDTTKLQFVCVAAPRPRLVNKDTGEIKTDKSGNPVYEVALSAIDATGRIELLRVNVSGEPPVTLGMPVHPVDLVGFVWEQTRGGEVRWGISYRAASILPAEVNALAR
ncbi:SCO3933 family regulatory protein [Streptosporangium sandarakinum]|uniref:SCO3933 family regulatory protein n=1 Tax=Streptosporangium sp. NPDC004379 TaxID=3366189 RepID=UPI00367EACF3